MCRFLLLQTGGFCSGINFILYNQFRKSKNVIEELKLV
jgi:hypothetical protein